MFDFDEEAARLARHDYTAEVFGGWAWAVNVVLDHGTWEGIPYPSHCRVTPIGAAGKPLPMPVLPDIHVHSWRQA